MPGFPDRPAVQGQNSRRRRDLRRRLLLGASYWEPQCNPAWTSDIYKELGWGSYNKGAFDGNFRPTKALDAFKN